MHVTLNTRPIDLNVVLANGKRAQIRIEPHHAWFDSKGWIRTFTIDYGDGTLATFKLLPNHYKAREVAIVAGYWLAQFGLSLAMNEVIRTPTTQTKGRQVVANVSNFVARQFAGHVVGAAYDKIAEHINTIHPEKQAYFEITSGELVIPRGIQLVLD